MEHEIKAALRDYRQRKPELPAFDKIVSVDFNQDRTPALVAVCSVNMQTLQFEMSLAEVGAAMMLYCQKNHVPLPRKGKKSLISVDGAPAFVVSYIWHNFSNIRIMLVDENEAVRTVIKKLMKQRDIESIIEVDSGLKALSILNNSKTFPNVIISNCHVGNISGIELMIRMRENINSNINQIPFVMLQRERNPYEMNEALRMGAEKVLLQPVSCDDLVGAVLDACSMNTASH
ncbi:hypothetical protein CCP2SC5_1280001 [Azospirillaceae bacterium]